MRQATLRLHSKGFTLVELVIVTVIITVLFGLTLHLVASAFNNWFMIAERRQVVEQSRVSMNRMVREIQLDFARGAYHSVDPWVASGFTPSPSELTFARVSQDSDASPGYDPWAPLNSARYTFDFGSRAITYRWYDGSVWLSAALETVLSNTSYSAFRYFQDDNTEIVPGGSGSLTDAETADIHTVELTIDNELSNDTQPFLTRTRIFPRNEGRPNCFGCP